MPATTQVYYLTVLEVKTPKSLSGLKSGVGFPAFYQVLEAKALVHRLTSLRPASIIISGSNSNLPASFLLSPDNLRVISLVKVLSLVTPARSPLLCKVLCSESQGLGRGCL